MRQLMLLGAALLVWPAAVYAQSRNDVHGFGGVTVGTSTFGSAASPTFGGRVGIGLTDHVQVVGEAGRLADISSPRFDVLGFTDVRVRVSAFYGEGGVRVAASPRATVRPYAEATAGFARLSAGISGIDDSTEAIINALNALSSTQPILGVGGGILMQAGQVSVDLGYRYKNIAVGDDIFGAVNEGKGYHLNQVRVGVGFRF